MIQYPIKELEKAHVTLKYVAPHCIVNHLAGWKYLLRVMDLALQRDLEDLTKLGHCPTERSLLFEVYALLTRSLITDSKEKNPYRPRTSKKSILS